MSDHAALIIASALRDGSVWIALGLALNAFLRK